MIASILVSGALFFIFTPNVIFDLPKRSNRFLVAGIHAILFSTVWYFISSKRLLEGFTQAEIDAATENYKAEHANEPGSNLAPKPLPPNYNEQQETKGRDQSFGYLPTWAQVIIIIMGIPYALIAGFLIIIILSNLRKTMGPGVFLL
jgi:hypothetical protein